MLENVQTPYATLLPDDDFQVPRALGECVRFLDAHSDYNSAHGKAITFSLQSLNRLVSGSDKCHLPLPAFVPQAAPNGTQNIFIIVNE